MKLFTRGKDTMPPVNSRVLSKVYRDDNYGRPVGPGGGYGWGGGPRRFVGSSRGPMPIVEVGREGDFPEGGHDWGPAPGDLGFPHSTRWPGWVPSWEQPFYATGSGFGGDRFLGGALLESRVSTVFACTDLISRTLSTMDVRRYIAETPLESLPWMENPEPEIYASMVDAMKALVNSLLHRGNAIVAPTARYEDGSVARWVVLNPDYVSIEPGANGMPRYEVGGIDIPADQLLHLRYQVWPGLVSGIGPLEACARNLISADAMERWGTELALTNGIPVAVLSSEAKLTKEQADAVKRSWAQAAMSRGTLPAVLSGGLSYMPMNLKPSDIGLLDLRTFDEARIASCFGVPLWLVGLPVNDGLTYSTVEGTFDYLWRATLRPIAYGIARAMSIWALPIGEQLRFQSGQLTEPDVAVRSTAYKTLIDAGVISPDEARVMEHLPPREGGPDTQALSTIRSQGV